MRNESEKKRKMYYFTFSHLHREQTSSWEEPDDYFVKFCAFQKKCREHIASCLTFERVLALQDNELYLFNQKRKRERRKKERRSDIVRLSRTRERSQTEFFALPNGERCPSFLPIVLLHFRQYTCSFLWWFLTYKRELACSPKINTESGDFIKSSKFKKISAVPVELALLNAFTTFRLLRCKKPEHCPHPRSRYFYIPTDDDFGAAHVFLISLITSDFVRNKTVFIDRITFSLVFNVA